MAYTLIDEKKVCRIYQDTEKALDKTLAHIVQLLDGEHQTIATAESCTGGMLSQMITSVPGASHVFELGLCTYAERMKTRLLGVPAELIAAHGVVSAEVAAAMVQGLRRQSDADLCLSVTGLAGPGGGTPEQPVGTVLGFCMGSKRQSCTCSFGGTDCAHGKRSVWVRLCVHSASQNES